MIDLKYSYILLFIIPKLIPLIIIFALRKDLRRVILVKGLMGGVLGLVADFLLTQYYWQPYTVFGRGIVSIEAFIYGFCAVALVAVLYLFVSNRRDRIAKLYESPKFIVRMLAHFVFLVFVGGGIIYCLTHFVGIDIMLAISAACIVAVLGVIIRIRDWSLIKKYLWHALIVVAIMLGLAVISYGLWWLFYPNFWSDVLIFDASWNIIILGFIPLSELLYWTLMLGAVEIELGEPPGRKIAKRTKKKK